MGHCHQEYSFVLEYIKYYVLIYRVNSLVFENTANLSTTREMIYLCKSVQIIPKYLNECIS